MDIPSFSSMMSNVVKGVILFMRIMPFIRPSTNHVSERMVSANALCLNSIEMLSTANMMRVLYRNTRGCSNKKDIPPTGDNLAIDSI